MTPNARFGSVRQAFLRLQAQDRFGRREPLMARFTKRTHESRGRWLTFVAISANRTRRGGGGGGGLVVPDYDQAGEYILHLQQQRDPNHFYV
jgi:hypothetical protein